MGVQLTHELCRNTATQKLNRFGLFVALFYGAAAFASQPDASLVYELEYTVTPEPSRGGAFVELRLRQPSRLLREVNMRADDQLISRVDGDGEIDQSDGRIRWKPPADGGRLRWFANLMLERSAGVYDSYIDAEWAVFRADDVIPPATTRTLKGAHSDTTLSFELPREWSSATQYPRKAGKYRVRNGERRFDRPTGWVALGRLGTRFEDIAGIRVQVAGPVGHSVRRMDTLALLHWTLPEIAHLFPSFPDRLTIISAGDPMWRGGLSGPASLFIHAERPLISENATSTLAHELVHVGMGNGAAPGADWIAEGLAELYSLEVLRRSGTISRERFVKALEEMRDRGESVASLCSDASRGERTARAVALLHDLDKEIRSSSRAKYSLDDVARAMAESESRLSAELLRSTAESFIGGRSDILEESKSLDCQRTT